MTRARSQAIVTQEAPVSEYESGVAEAINNFADATRTLAAVVASCAAASHTQNPYDQRQLASVLWEDAQNRFGDILAKLNKKKRAELEAWIDGLCRGKR